jgi:hypothetical protein
MNHWSLSHTVVKYQQRFTEAERLRQPHRRITPEAGAHPRDMLGGQYERSKEPYDALASQR